VKLSEYIKKLQDLLEEVGDTIDLYQSIDDEGNGFNLVEYSPSIRYLNKNEDWHRPDSLIPEKPDDESNEDYASDWGLELKKNGEIDWSGFKKVVLL
jgi:hypothetical protein